MLAVNNLTRYIYLRFLHKAVAGANLKLLLYLQISEGKLYLSVVVISVFGKRKSEAHAVAGEYIARSLRRAPPHAIHPAARLHDAQLQVLLFHHARGRDYLSAASLEDRLRVAGSERLKAANLFKRVVRGQLQREMGSLCRR